MNHPVYKMNVMLGEGETPSHLSPQEGWEPAVEEGQLSVDVAQDAEHIIVISTLAGAIASEIEVFIRHDMLTIRGHRVSPLAQDDHVDYFHTECFWGAFSRTIILPAEVKGDLADAEYKNGVLVIRVPKHVAGQRVPIRIIEE